MSSQRASRFKAELAQLTSNPPPGIDIRVDEEQTDVIFADISGPEGSPFEKGTFTVEVALSERYPFTPPNARFITPIYHPNVDTTGRICLSGLKPKPSGTWNCSLNIAVILSAIRLLLNEPNLGDPLMADIAAEYQNNFNDFRVKAQAKTRQFAMKGQAGSPSAEDQDTQPIQLSAAVQNISRPLKTPNENLDTKIQSLSPSKRIEKPTKNVLKRQPSFQANQSKETEPETQLIQASAAVQPIPRSLKSTIEKAAEIQSPLKRIEKPTKNVFKRQPSFQANQSKSKQTIEPEPEVIDLGDSDDDFEDACRPSRSKKVKLRK